MSAIIVGLMSLTPGGHKSLAAGYTGLPTGQATLTCT